MKMSELRICRICLDSDVQLYQISGSKVQDVFEKLTNTQVQDDGTLYSVCYLCYWQLKKCQQLVIKSRKTEELLKQIWLVHTELNLKSVLSVDRLAYGLVHSLKISKTESFQTPECYEHVKSKKLTASHSCKVMIKDEPEDDWTHTTEQCCESDEKQIFIHNKVSSMENISGSQKNAFAEVNESSNIISSLMFGKTETLKIPEWQNINSENPRVSNTYEVMIKVDPEEDGTHTTEELREPDERQNFIQDKAKCIENITENQKKTFAEENESSKILCNEMSKQVLVDDNKKYFMCNDCGKMFYKKGLIIKHISRYNCLNMNVENKSIKNYIHEADLTKCVTLKNSSTHTRENPTRKHNKIYKCKVCNNTYNYKSTLITHIRTHTGEKPFKCNYCNYACNGRSHLTLHVRTHTGEKPYKCDYCNYTCKSHSDLKVHIRTHTGEKPYECKYCNYKCRASASLTRHVRRHTGEKPFKCESCNYTCITSNRLKKHVTKHTGEKPYECEYCNYSCTEAFYLKIHVRKHTREKPFKCTHCNYTCADGSNLKIHVRRKHTGEKPFKCTHCNYTCADGSYLKKHERKHTGEKSF